MLVAMATAAITAGGPAIAASIADYARNADQVDGKHAVGAATTSAKRAGKLVATNSSGRLPNNIIAKAPDAAKLNGRSAAQVRPLQVSSDNNQAQSLPTATWTAVHTVTITVPSAGRIQVSGLATLYAPGTEQAHALLWVSSSPTATQDFVGLARWTAPRPGNQGTVPVLRTFRVSAPGTYTYHLMGDSAGEEWSSVQSSRLTAQFFPG